MAILEKSQSLRSDVKQLTKTAGILCLVLMASSYIINAMDRQIFPVLLTWITKTYGFSLKEAGLLSTVFTLGLGIAGIPTGYMLDRWSRKSVMVVGTIIYSGFTLATIFAIGFMDMLVYRAITGIGEAMQNAALFSAVGSYFYKNRTLALGTLNFAYGLGSFFGPYFGTKMTIASGNWHTPFYVYAFVGLGFAALVWILIPKVFSESKGPAATIAQNRPAALNVPEKLWNRNVILCAVAAVIVGFSIYGYVGLYTTFLIKQLNFEPMVAGLALSLYGIGALMGIPAGWIGDRLPQRWVIICSFGAAMIIGYMLFNVATEPLHQQFLSFLQGTFGSGFLFVNVYSLTQRSVRPELVGRASGIYVTCLYLASSTAGFLFAWLVGVVGWGGAGLIELSLFPIVGIIAMLLIKEDQLITAAPKSIISTGNSIKS